MLDFCPFDFNKIDMNNLAYELVFADEWTWEKSKEKDGYQEDPKPFINENDDRRNTHYKDREDKKFVEVQHVVLLENRNPRGKNGFQQLLELISTRNGYGEEHGKRIRTERKMTQTIYRVVDMVMMLTQN